MGWPGPQMGWPGAPVLAYLTYWVMSGMSSFQSLKFSQGLFSQEFFIAFTVLDLFAIAPCHPWSLRKYSNSLPPRNPWSLCLPSPIRTGLFVRILHRFCARTANLYLFTILKLFVRIYIFAILALQFFISLQEHQLFISSDLHNPWTLCNAWSFRKNLSLRNPWTLRKNSFSQFFSSL